MQHPASGCRHRKRNEQIVAIATNVIIIRFASYAYTQQRLNSLVLFSARPDVL
jgi:hypothetical protein